MRRFAVLYINPYLKSWKYRRKCRILALVLGLSLSAVSVRAQKPAHPLTVGDVINLLKKRVPPERIIFSGEKYRLGFQLSPKIERELRQEGATSELLQALKNLSDVPPATPVAPGLGAADTALLLGAMNPAQVAKEHFSRGDEFFAKADWRPAIAEYCEAFQIKPDLNETRLSLAHAFENAEDWQDAGDVYREIVSLEPSNSEIHLLLGIALRKAGDWNGAILAEKEAISLKPDSAEAHHQLGIALRTIGDWDGDIAEQQLTVRLDPKHYAAYQELGVAQGILGRWNDEVADERKAIQLQPSDVQAHVALSKALMRRGDLGGASAELRKVADLKPANGAAHAALGTALEIEGNKQGALNEYRAATKLDPTNVRFQRLYKGLAQALGVGGRSDNAQEHQPNNIVETQALPLYVPNPPYTDQALKAGFHGSCTFELKVEKNGNVASVKETGKKLGNGIDQQVIATGRTWKFRPEMRNGVPVSSVVHTTVEYIPGDVEPESKPSRGTSGAEYQDPCSTRAIGKEPGQVFSFRANDLTSEITPPTLIFAHDPPYTEEARKDKIHGAAILSIVVDSKGNVAYVREEPPILGGGLEESAMQTVFSWKFKPGTRNGRPVAVQVMVQVNFRLFD